MKRTFTRTLFIPDLREAKVRITVFDKPKYEVDAEEEGREVNYTGLTAWDIVSGGEEAEAIEAETDESGIDDNHEYLVLHFEDGSTATFRNSYVDMWLR